MATFLTKMKPPIVLVHLATLYLAVAELKGTKEFTCPAQCQCYASFERDNQTNWDVLCHNKHISTVPKLSTLKGEIIETLSLRRNRIKKIGPHSLVNSLKQLDLSHNPGIQITHTTFQDITNTLVFLKVEHCSITQLSPLTFRNLTQLETLVMSYNDIQYIGALSFYGAVKLKTLFINKNCITAIDNKGFAGLEMNLRNIYLGNNDIKVVPIAAILYLRNLRVLDLSGNKIENIHFPTSMNMSIKTLNLAGNRINVIRNGNFYGVPSLELLNLNHNRLTTLEHFTFQGLQSLHHLNIDGNQLKYIHSWAFEALADTLRVLSIADNILEKGKVYTAIYVLNNLKVLNISNNELEALPKKTKGKFFKTLHTFQASSNRLQVLPKKFLTKFKQLKSLDLSGNNFKKIEVFPEKLGKTLRALDLSKTFDGHTVSIKPNSLSSLQSLQFLSLSANNFSNQDIELILDSEFNSMRVLDLSYNQLTNISMTLIKERCNHLESIDLTGNKIQKIHENSFKMCKKLLTLSLGDNQINYLDPGAFRYLETRLERLNLTANEVTSINESGIGSLSRLTEFYFSQNPIVCRCDKLNWMRSFMIDPGSTCILSDNKHTMYVYTFLQSCTTKEETITSEKEKRWDKKHSSPPYTADRKAKTSPINFTTETSHILYTKQFTGVKLTTENWEILSADNLNEIHMNATMIEDTIVVRWTFPDSLLPTIRHNTVTYRQFGKMEIVHFDDLSSSTRTTKIYDINLEKNYIMCVTVVTYVKSNSLKKCAEVISRYVAKSESSPFRFKRLINLIQLAAIGVLSLVVIVLTICLCRRKRNTTEYNVNT